MANLVEKKELQDPNDNVQLDPVASVNNVFASHVPKHAMEGISDAAQNVVTGVGIGLGSLFALPVVGWQQEGAKGAAKGLAIGAAGLVGMSIYGVGAGVRQMMRGLYNTPKALTEVVKGEKYWDSLQREWLNVHLDSALAELPVNDDDLFTQAAACFQEMTEKLSLGINETSINTKETTCVKDYYAIIGVSRTATSDEIHRAFYKKALQTHPDKNPGDTEAKMRFQELLEANNVLSDDMRRAHYDRHGTVDSVLSQHSSFTQMEEDLGATFLEVFVGRMSYALQFIPDIFIDHTLQKEFQRRRTLRLAQHLLCYVDKEDGLEAILPLIRDAVSTRIGPKFMPIVAQQYITAARQHLSEYSLLRELDSFLMSKWAFIVRVADVTAAGIPAAYKAARKTLMEDDVLNLIAAICEKDVQRTVLRASRLILYDSSVSLERRYQRAKNLSILGHMVKKTCQDFRSE